MLDALSVHTMGNDGLGFLINMWLIHLLISNCILIKMVDVYAAFMLVRFIVQADPQLICCCLITILIVSVYPVYLLTPIMIYPARI